MKWSTDDRVNELLKAWRDSKDQRVDDVDTFEGEYLRESRQVGGNHYQLPIEPIDYIVKNELGYREGNVVKYVTRHKSKNGKEDIMKAIHYLEMILKDYNE